MQPITIDKNVPLPNRGPRRDDDPVRIALLALEIGDSFWVPKEGSGKSFASNIITRAERLDIKVTVRSAVNNDGVKGWRVWRKI